jgi:hypothetical protein
MDENIFKDKDEDFNLNGDDVNSSISNKALVPSKLVVAKCFKRLLILYLYFIIISIKASLSFACSVT